MIAADVQNALGIAGEIMVIPAERMVATMRALMEKKLLPS